MNHQKNAINLFDAISRGDWNGCLEELSAGAPVDGEDGYRPYGQTPLQTAIRAEKESIACKLIDMGADVNKKDTSGRTPLHDAAEQGMASVCEALLENGARHVKDDQDLYPVHLAAKHFHVAVIRTLHRYQVDLCVRSQSGADAMQVALCSPIRGKAERTDDLIDTLLTLKNCGLSLKDPDLLQHGFRGWPLKVVDFLLDEGIDANNQQALFAAAYIGSWDGLRLLFSRGADPFIRSEEGINLLMKSATKTLNPCILGLIDLGLDVNERNAFDRTALSTAAMQNDDTNGYLLSALGADVYQEIRRIEQDNESLTASDQEARLKLLYKLLIPPIHCAAASGCAEVVTRLLEEGRDPQQRDHLGRTAIDVANQENAPEMADLIQSWQARKRVQSILSSAQHIRP